MSIVLIVPIDTIFLDLHLETVDPNVTAEFHFVRYVCPIRANHEGKGEQ